MQLCNFFHCCCFCCWCSSCCLLLSLDGHWVTFFKAGIGTREKEKKPFKNLSSKNPALKFFSTAALVQASASLQQQKAVAPIFVHECPFVQYGNCFPLSLSLTLSHSLSQLRGLWERNFFTLISIFILHPRSKVPALASTVIKSGIRHHFLCLPCCGCKYFDLESIDKEASELPL